MDGKLFSSSSCCCLREILLLFCLLSHTTYTLSQQQQQQQTLRCMFPFSFDIQTCHVGSIWTYLTGMYESYGWC
jgi:hypothetical protein